MGGSISVAKSGKIVGVLALAGIIASVMQTLVVPLIGELPRILNTSASNASWVITSTLLAAAIATPVTGRLGDLYGKKRMMLILLVPLIVGSVVCALAGSLLPMIIGRALQGIGAGIVPLAISALRDLLPPERLGSAIALISASMGIGGALGLPISAAVTEQASWRVLFWAVAVLCLLVAVATWLVVPATPAGAQGRFDPLGALGLGVGLLCLLLGISKGADWGWASGAVLGLFAASLVILLVWGWWELRTSDPLVDLRVTARPQVLLTNAASIVVGFAMYAQALIVPQLLQLPKATGYGLGTSMLTAGLVMAPGGLMMMLLAPVGGKLTAARGPKATLLIGTLVIALGYASSLALMGSVWGLMIVGCICSIGVGLAYGAMPALIMGAVPVSETASANSFNTLMRSIGTAVSAAVVGLVLAQMTIQMGGYALPSENGFRTGLLLGGGAALLAAAIILTIPVRRAGRPAERSVTTEVPVKAVV
ncbi:MFS transporter [Actinomadura alba]|uniref:MFS transporter n=1 Tax=Actinomadura alba TaxID=406431 RepID=A0ABR7LRA6_9ACTN|nr:MFS transporter [Actinomadura alba]MBC6467375.1 MFS transporter [Actinomadura alba]